MFTENQLSILSSFVRDNNLIIKEVENTCLMNDETFSNRITSIKNFIWQLHQDVIDDAVPAEFVVETINTLLYKLVFYRNSYNNFGHGTCGHEMYKVMNSLVDKTNESYKDFFETL